MAMADKEKALLLEDGFVKPKVKQAVISQEDVKAMPVVKTSEPKGFRVKITGLRGQYQGIHFNDECIAEGVDDGHLSVLKGHFGESVVEILPGE
jgi:hypothetical protein